MVGEACLYCVKTFNGQFRAKYKSMRNMKECLKEEEVQEAFDGVRIICVDRVKESGDTGVRMTGSAVAAVKGPEVSHKRKRESFLSDPQDEIWDEQLYVREHGHWTTNGQGHVKGTFEGKTGILVPARKIWKIQRRQGSEAEMKTIVDDGTEALSETQADDNFNVLSSQFDMPAIVGATLDQCFSGGSGSSSGMGTRHSPLKRAESKEELNSPASNKRKQPPKAVASPFGLSFTFGQPADVEVLEEESPGVQKKKGTNQKSVAGKTTGAGAKPPMPGKAVHKGRTGGGGVPKGAAGGRGRPGHDNLVIGREQIKLWKSTTPFDPLFFGDGFQKHKGFLVRVKTNLETRLAASTER